MIAIMDYGVGNLFSLKSSLAHLGLDAAVSTAPAGTACARRLTTSSSSVHAASMPISMALQPDVLMRRRMCPVSSKSSASVFVPPESIAIKQRICSTSSNESMARELPAAAHSLVAAVKSRVHIPVKPVAEL